MKYLVSILALLCTGCAAKHSVQVLPMAALGEAYRVQLVGGTLVSGTIPPGLSLSVKGMLIGTPSQPGHYSFTVTP